MNRIPFVTYDFFGYLASGLLVVIGMELTLGFPRVLGQDLKAIDAAIAYAYGWRMQSEVLTLERRHLDLEAGTPRLDPGTTKNDEGRVVYLTPELKTSSRPSSSGSRQRRSARAASSVSSSRT